jgi:hypothetical protein
MSLLSNSDACISPVATTDGTGMITTWRLYGQGDVYSGALAEETDGYKITASFVMVT